MSALHWGIKGSLIGYVRGMADGSVVVTGGADEGVDGFVFPAAATSEAVSPAGASTTGAGTHLPAPGLPLVFRGAVVLTGHSGMLRLTFADLRLEADGDAFALTIADPDDANMRMRFARIEGFDTAESGRLTARATTLTAEGADLFFGPYEEGTALDDPVVCSTDG